jgi:hypothetical protein
LATITVATTLTLTQPKGLTVATTVITTTTTKKVDWYGFPGHVPKPPSVLVVPVA